MRKWMKSADGWLKKAKEGITNLMPAWKYEHSNADDPTSALSMSRRKTRSKATPMQQANSLNK